MNALQAGLNSILFPPLYLLMERGYGHRRCIKVMYVFYVMPVKTGIQNAIYLAF
jgi:hypothetical protein